MKLSIKAGATSETVNLFIQDSSKTDGSGLTGLVFNTASLTAYYGLPKAAAVSITLATLVAVTSAYSSGGFKEIDATNMPGWYRFDVPNAAIAGASGRFVSIHFKGATNMAPLPLEIELTGWDNQDATAGGISRMDAAISSRSTYAGADTSGTTTLLTRIPGTVQPQTGDAYARLGAPAGASVSADVASVKTDSSGLRTDYTTARAGYLDTLNGLVAAIWANATRTLSSVAAIVNGIWDEATASHQTAGTMGKALSSASAAGDPWAVPLPGSYAPGTAGRIVGGTPNTYAQQGAGDTPLIGR